MNVLHVNCYDIFGGAAIAGYRLHQGMIAQGIASSLLVADKRTTSQQVATIPVTWLDRQLRKITARLGVHDLNFISTFALSRHPFYVQADILNFHNLHAGYFNYLALPALTHDKPVVWTLHDMWSLTGDCSYANGCEQWKTGCKKCPPTNAFAHTYHGNVNLGWRLKRGVYQHSQVTLVTPSHWLAEQVRQSILQQCTVHHIPYGIDLELYRPLEREQCRALLGIPKAKRVLLFGAHQLNHPRKGGDLLLNVLLSLPPTLKAEILLVTVGDGGEHIAEMVGIPTLNLGYVGGDRLKAIAFSAADLLLFPTRADNLPLILQESLACGLPMISFRVGGVPEIVRSGSTGLLAEPEDVKGFAEAIIQLLENPSLRSQMAYTCREIAITEYPLHLQVQRYLDVYRQLLHPPDNPDEFSGRTRASDSPGVPAVKTLQLGKNRCINH